MEREKILKEKKTKAEHIARNVITESSIDSQESLSVHWWRERIEIGKNTMRIYKYNLSFWQLKMNMFAY